MANLKGWEAIKAKSEEIGWPSNFKTDLYAKCRAFLESDCAPEQFGWTVSPNTADLFCLADVDALWRAWTYKGDSWRNWFWFDGEVITQVSFYEFFPMLFDLEWSDDTPSGIYADWKQIGKRIDELEMEYLTRNLISR